MGEVEEDFGLLKLSGFKHVPLRNLFPRLNPSS